MIQICLTFMAKQSYCFLGPVSVEEQVSVENVPCARFARYGRKINILTCLWFYVWWKIDLMEPRLKKNTSNSLTKLLAKKSHDLKRPKNSVHLRIGWKRNIQENKKKWIKVCTMFNSYVTGRNLALVSKSLPPSMYAVGPAKFELVKHAVDHENQSVN